MLQRDYSRCSYHAPVARSWDQVPTQLALFVHPLLITSHRSHLRWHNSHRNFHVTESFQMELTKQSMASLVVLSKFYEWSLKYFDYVNYWKPWCDQNFELARMIDFFTPPTFSMLSIILITIMQRLATVGSLVALFQKPNPDYWIAQFYISQNPLNEALPVISGTIESKFSCEWLYKW